MSSDDKPFQREPLNELQRTLTMRLLILLSCGADPAVVESWKERARASGLNDERVELILADCREIQRNISSSAPNKTSGLQ